MKPLPFATSALLFWAALSLRAGENWYQPGRALISLAGGFTDGTVFSPITDGKHVWFFNRCSSMGCYAASPTRVGRYLFLPVVTGTLYGINTEIDSLRSDALVAINDFGPGGETWTLATVTYADHRLYAHTMKENLCIEAGEK